MSQENNFSPENKNIKPPNAEELTEREKAIKTLEEAAKQALSDEEIDDYLEKLKKYRETNPVE